jgi:hypothetical protein
MFPTLDTRVQWIVPTILEHRSLISTRVLFYHGQEKKPRIEGPRRDEIVSGIEHIIGLFFLNLFLCI